MEAVREGVESTGWLLSGLQKTTSQEFEGQWEGESTRSAYLFFHHGSASREGSIDVYLDETTRGLTGNLALVVDLAPLARVGDPAQALGVLARLSRREMPSGYSTPLTLRLRLGDGGVAAAAAQVEARFKLTLPEPTIEAGGDAVRTLAVRAIASFERILESAELAQYRPGG